MNDTILAVITSVGPLAILFLIIYFLAIRPQRKVMKKHKQMIATLKSGDVVKTVAGIRGRVIKIDDKSLKLEIAPDVQVDVDSSKIESKVEGGSYTSPMKCPSCGTELNPGDQYCGTCGKLVLPSFEPPPPPPPQY